MTTTIVADSAAAAAAAAAAEPVPRSRVRAVRVRRRGGPAHEAERTRGARWMRIRLRRRKSVLDWCRRDYLWAVLRELGPVAVPRIPGAAGRVAEAHALAAGCRSSKNMRWRETAHAKTLTGIAGALREVWGRTRRRTTGPGSWAHTCRRWTWLGFPMRPAQLGYSDGENKGKRSWGRKMAVSDCRYMIGRWPLLIARSSSCFVGHQVTSLSSDRRRGNSIRGCPCTTAR